MRNALWVLVIALIGCVAAPVDEVSSTSQASKKDSPSSKPDHGNDDDDDDNDDNDDDDNDDDDDDDDDGHGHGHGHGHGKARLKLKQPSSTSAKQSSSHAWSLDKVGSVDSTSQTVMWNITATQSPTATHQLVVSGRLTVRNHGQGPATIGNVVVELEHRPGNQWVTAAANVADATAGDAATSVSVENETITESAGSGTLALRDANTQAAISLVPQISVPAGVTRKVEFTATFDNSALGLPTGRKIRANVIASFGNAGPGNTAANVDINGNGTIDADEVRVDSARLRLGQTKVPAPAPDTTQVTLTDTAGDISTTGTVSFANPIFNLGATSGTVTVEYAGGTDGGTITNCAHLDGAGVDLDDCDTQSIPADEPPPPPPCTHGTPGCPWQDGDFISGSQSQWGDPANAMGALLTANYNSVYASTGGVLEVGIFGIAGFSMAFTSAAAVLAYNPQIGAPGPLDADHTNPSTTASGSFGGEDVALALNVAFSDAGVTPVAFGELTLCGLTSTPTLNGLTVRDFLGVVNNALGGGSTSIPIPDLSVLAGEVNVSFSDGSPNAFAQAHLVNAPCP